MSCTVPRSKSSQRAARNREVPAKSAPHFPEVDPKGIVRLRDYQVGKHDEVLAHLAAGARVVPLVLPTGAGKTTICKAIAAGWFTGGPDRLVIILGPTRAVVRQFQEPGPRIDNGHETVPWRADEDPQVGLPQPTPAQLVDLAWLSTARGIFISTRQAWGRGLMLKKLADAPFEADGLRNLLVIADEAHHHHRKSAAGKLVAELERRGATVIPVTATPYYELGPLFPPEVEARAVRISSVEFAQMTDEHGRPYCPREWDFTRHFVGESSDVADAYDTGAKLKRGKAQRALEACRAMAAQWAKDGTDAAGNGVPQRPKAIFFLPERTWVAPMQRALAEVGAARDRVVDFTGDDLSDDALELLDRERKVKRYQDSEVDAILSCARFDEGTDWPLCAVGYCWRIPDSVVRVLQRLGRTSRGKSRIEGYPERWKDAQTMRFFVRKLSGDGAAEAWRKHGELALVLGLFLADYREALRWARVVGTERGDREDTAGDKVPRPRPPRETDPLVLARAKHRAMQFARRPGATAGYVLDKVRQEFPTLTLNQAKSLVAVTVRRRDETDEEAAARRAKVEADLLERQNREGCGLVLEDREEAFAALLDEILDRPVEEDGALLREIGLRFGAEDIEGFVERFRAAGEGAGYPYASMTPGQLEAFALEHGRRHFERTGKWPSNGHGAIEEVPGALWHSLDAALRRFGSSLRMVRGLTIRELNARAIRAFYDKRGFWPRGRAQGSDETRLGRALGTLRRLWPDLCDKYGIPHKADLCDAIRRGKGKAQISCADVLLHLCQHPTTSEKTPAMNGETGKALHLALRQRHRGVGSTKNLPILCQVNGIARLRAERDADCWRLWLDGADAPDPRPWAEILAAGDNKRVVRAERVAFLDWDRPTGPTVRDWKEPGFAAKRQMAARRPWSQAQWPDLRAEPAAKPKRKARK